MTYSRLFTMALVLCASAFTLTSCDDDPWEYDYYNYYDDWYDDYNWYGDAFNYGNNTLNQEAAALRGYWTGQVEEQYYDQYGKLQSNTMYADFEFDQYNTKSLNGRGRETDYVPATDDYGNVLYDQQGNIVYDSRELRFAWYIDPRTGDINLKYDDNGYTFNCPWDGGFNLDTQTGQFYGEMTDQQHRLKLLFNLSRTTLAKPNIENADTQTGKASEGQVFGSRKEVGTTFSSPKKLGTR